MSAVDEHDTRQGGTKTSMDVLRALAARAAAADSARKPFLQDLVMKTFQGMTPEDQLLAIESGVLEMSASAASPPTEPRDAGTSAAATDTRTDIPERQPASIAAKIQSRPLNASAQPFTEASPYTHTAPKNTEKAGSPVDDAVAVPVSKERDHGQRRRSPSATATKVASDTSEEPTAPTKSIVLDPCAFRTIMCPFFLRRTVCPNGKRCMYCHGKGQMRTREQNEEEGITTLAAIDEYLCEHENDHDHAPHSAVDGGLVERNNVASRYRTQLCKAFETGCRRGAACPFAHGTEQLRTKHQNIKEGLVTDEAVHHFALTGELPALTRSHTSRAATAAMDAVTAAESGSERSGRGEKSLSQHALMEAEQREATKEYTIATAFRTQLCPYASSEHCPRGHRCQRAHGRDQLRTHQQNIDDGITTFVAANYFKEHGHPPGWGPLPPPQPQLVTEIPKPSTFRTRMCSYYGPGKCCKHGDWCVYAHGDAQMRTEEQNLEDGITSLEAIERYLRSQKAPSGGTPQDTRESFVASCLRTQLCPNYKKGCCELGSKCRRAHDKQQLRTREQNIADGIVTREAVDFFLDRGYPAPPGTDFAAELGTTMTSPTSLVSPNSINSPTAFFVLANPTLVPLPNVDAQSQQAILTLQSLFDQGAVSPARQADAQRTLFVWHQLQEMRNKYFDFTGKPIQLSLEETGMRNQIYGQLCQLLVDE